MPTYGYRCRACGHEFEEFQSILASPTRTCPKCKKRRVERQLSTGGAVLFKGGGFYETDYRSAEYEKSRSADAKAAEPKADEKKTEQKAQAKPDATKDTKNGTKSPAVEPPKSAPKDSAKESVKETVKESVKEKKTVNESKKSHARQGRGVGNIVQASRAAGAGKKRGTRR